MNAISTTSTGHLARLQALLEGAHDRMESLPNTVIAFVARFSIAGPFLGHSR